MKDKVLVLKLGKTVGLNGNMRFFLETDFPETLQKNTSLVSNKNHALVIKDICFDKKLISFYQIDNIDSAKKLTNLLLYMDIKDTRDLCKLKENEYFWFDIIGLDIYEDNLLLGTVKDIQRLPSCDYLEVLVNNKLKLDIKLPKIFLIPYLDKFIIKVDKINNKIIVKNSLDILKNS